MLLYLSSSISTILVIHNIIKTAVIESTNTLTAVFYKEGQFVNNY